MNRYVLCAVLAGSVIALSTVFQPSITYNDGLGWDGAQYAELTSQCGRTQLRALEPFTYRIGMPCLAALVPAPPRMGLRVVNSAASVLLLFLLDAWLRRHLSNTAATIALVAFAFHWLAPLRQVWWYPTYIDPGALCAIVGALLLSQRFVPFVLVCFAGALIRETTIIVPIALLFGSRIARLLPTPYWSVQDARVNFQTALAGVVATLAGIGLTHLIATPTSDYWIADAAFYWAYTKPLPEYLLAIFITYGPALSLLVVGWSAVKAHLTRFPEHAMMLALVLVLAWIGGSDTERFLMWGSPIMLLLIGKAAESVNWASAKPAAAVLVVAQIVNGRWLLTIPPNFVESPARVWPVLTVWSAQSYLQLYSQSPDRLMGAVALLEYLLLCAALVAGFTSFRDRQPAARTQ
jgi:hypothetical protein